MISMGKEIRLRHIFRERDRAVLVAMDHGVSAGPIEGLEDIGKAVANAAKGGASAVILHKGLVRFAAPYLGNGTGLILHLSASMTISTKKDRKVLVADVVEALAYGPDAISVHTNMGGDDDDMMLADLGATAASCDRFGMPLLVMAYPRGANVKDPFHVDVVKHTARAAAELGADIVKTNYTGGPDTFREVVRGCPVPVLVAGGPKMESDRATLEVVKGAMDAGAAGVSIGRNIFQHKDPVGMCRAIARIVYDGAAVDDVYRW